jgi:hypothetical protein
MRIIARGWSRDHGPKEILKADLSDTEVVGDAGTYHKGETYLEVKNTVRELLDGGSRVIRSIRVSGDAALSLNGSYQIQLELSQSDIARLFYLTNSDRRFCDLVTTFASFRSGDEEEVAA